MISPESRSLFGFAPHTVYLNHGGYGVAPLPVMEARFKKLKEIEANPTQFLAHEFPEAKRKAAALVAKRFSVRAEDLALVTNITEAASAVLRSFPLSAGDEILTTSLIYGALGKAAHYIAGRNGAKICQIIFPFPNPDPAHYIELVRKAITPRTKLAIFDHITSGTTLILPIAEMTKVCREHGVAVFVDGAHVPGNIALDIDAIGADWYAANLHKWYFAPRGCGFLWVSPKRQAGLVPAALSWTVDQPFPECFSWTGTDDPTRWLSIPDAFAFMDRFGEDKVRQHNHKLVHEGLVLLAHAWGTNSNVPDAIIGSMGLVPLPDGLPYAPNEEGGKQFERVLWENHKIAVSVSYMDKQRLWVRVSAQIYNGVEDYRRLAEAALIMRKG